MQGQEPNLQGIEGSRVLEDSPDLETLAGFLRANGQGSQLVLQSVWSCVLPKLPSFHLTLRKACIYWVLTIFEMPENGDLQWKKRRFPPPHYFS